MFDHFLEIACRQDQQHALRNEMAEHFKMLPVEELQKIASGELKLADCCDSGEDDWLSKFRTTPLYPQALSLEEELLQLDVAEQQQQHVPPAPERRRETKDVEDRAPEEGCSDRHLAARDRGHDRRGRSRLPDPRRAVPPRGR